MLTEVETPLLLEFKKQLLASKLRVVPGTLQAIWVPTQPSPIDPSVLGPDIEVEISTGKKPW